MQNVMTLAWEIARKGQKKFGGKVREYIAEALRQAWRIVKNAMKKDMVTPEKFGFVELQRKNGVIFFIVDHVDGMTVTLLDRNPYNGLVNKVVINDYKLGTNKKSGKEARLYDVAINAGDIEIKLDDDVMIIPNSLNRDQLKTKKRWEK
jgi:hypothetical protein